MPVTLPPLPSPGDPIFADFAAREKCVSSGGTWDNVKKICIPKKIEEEEPKEKVRGFPLAAQREEDESQKEFGARGQRAGGGEAFANQSVTAEQVLQRQQTLQPQQFTPDGREVVPEDSLLSKGATGAAAIAGDRKSTRLNSSHTQISHAVFCLK